MLDLIPGRRYGFSEELYRSWMHYFFKPPLKDQAWMLTEYPLGVSSLPPLSCGHSCPMLMAGQWASLIISVTPCLKSFLLKRSFLCNEDINGGLGHSSGSGSRAASRLQSPAAISCLQTRTPTVDKTKVGETDGGKGEGRSEKGGCLC